MGFVDINEIDHDREAAPMVRLCVGSGQTLGLMIRNVANDGDSVHARNVPKVLRGNFQYALVKNNVEDFRNRNEGISQFQSTVATEADRPFLTGGLWGNAGRRTGNVRTLSEILVKEIFNVDMDTVDEIF
jgi:hypothetical protein